MGRLPRVGKILFSRCRFTAMAWRGAQVCNCLECHSRATASNEFSAATFSASLRLCARRKGQDPLAAACAIHPASCAHRSNRLWDIRPARGISPCLPASSATANTCARPDIPIAKGRRHRATCGFLRHCWWHSCTRQQITD